jgi:hypothetical protein
MATPSKSMAGERHMKVKHAELRTAREAVSRYIYSPPMQSGPATNPIPGSEAAQENAWSSKRPRQRVHPTTEKLINPLVLLLPLYNYTMTYHHLTLLEGQYSHRSQYDEPQRAVPAYPCGPLLPWPPNGYFEQFQRDAALLKEVLSPYAGPRDATLAEQVFGSQARQQRIGLGHLANVLYERALLHQKHLRDIDWRLVDCQDRLSVLKMHFPLDGGRPQQHLEKLILELEKQRHDEEIGFWKDSAEIRQQLFENAALYGAAQRRQDMLYGVEVNGI